MLIYKAVFEARGPVARKNANQNKLDIEQNVQVTWEFHYHLFNIVI